jgi:hypothetical protein
MTAQPIRGAFNNGASTNNHFWHGSTFAQILFVLPIGMTMLILLSILCAAAHANRFTAGASNP